MFPSFNDILTGADGLTIIVLCLSLCIAGIMLADAILHRPLNSGEGRPHREDGSPVSPSFHNSGIDRD